ncbi:MAG: hypothetical protein RMK31_07025 [Candidatus Caldarchaeum sp.]|nr:hypothetical protein [Candidatus Caldarchaeum sp.]
MEEKVGEVGEEIAKTEETETKDVLAALTEMRLTPSQLKRYFRAASKLRALEKTYGKSYAALVKDYEKKLRESVKLEYAISELLDKRRKIEEDLKMYMDQHKLTLETVNKVASLIKSLEKHSVDVNNLEQVARAAAKMASTGLDVNQVFEKFARLDEVETKLAEASLKLQDAEKKLGLVESELSLKQQRLREISEWVPEVETLGDLLQRLRKSVAEMEDKYRELSNKLEETAREYETLFGFKGKAEDVLRTIEEKKRELTSLEEEIEKRRETIEVLEDEAASARSLMLLLQSPELVKREDLEALARQFANVAKVKAGEIQVLKPLEQSLIENVRRKVVEFVLPALKNDFVPRWVFERLEREFKEAVSRRSQLEEETERLKAELSRLGGVRQASAETVVSQQPVFFKLRNSGQYLKDDNGTRVKLKCPSCQTVNLLVLPSKTELENAISEMDKLLTNCVSCTKTISVDPANVYERFYRVERT